MKKEAIVANLPISFPDRVIVGIHFGEYKKAVRQGLMGENSSFDVEIEGQPKIVITTREPGTLPTHIRMEAYYKMMRLLNEGFDYSGAHLLFEGQVKIIKK